MNREPNVPVPAFADEPTLPTIELESLDEVAGGCAACGTAAAPGQAAMGGNPALAAGLMQAFNRR